MPAILIKVVLCWNLIKVGCLLNGSCLRMGKIGFGYSNKLIFRHKVLIQFDRYELHKHLTVEPLNRQP